MQIIPLLQTPIERDARQVSHVNSQSRRYPPSFFSLLLYVTTVRLIVTTRSKENDFPPFSLSFSLSLSVSHSLRNAPPLVRGDNRGGSRGKMIFRREYRALRERENKPRDLISPPRRVRRRRRPWSERERGLLDAPGLKANSGVKTYTHTVVRIFSVNPRNGVFNVVIADERASLNVGSITVRDD